MTTIPARVRWRRPHKASRTTHAPSRAWSGLATAMAILAAITAWHIASRVVGNPLLVPPVDIIARALAADVVDGSLAANAWASLYRVLMGFLIGAALAIPSGFVLGWYPKVRIAVEPFIQFMRVIPPIGLIPLLIIYLGIGETARIFVIALAAFLAIIVAVYQGVREVDPVLIRAARVLGAGNISIFIHVIAPGSLPYLLVGMRQGLANAWGSLVAAELIASSKGLGYLILSSQEKFQVSHILVGIISIGVIGMVMDKMLLVAQQKLAPWNG